MATAPLPIEARSVLPEYLPARMVNEFVYCPRLFFYEWVEGVFRESTDTVEGSVQHRRVDREGKGMPAAAELGDEKIHGRSITLSSEQYKVIAKMDLIELEDQAATPVDYKHGKPRERDGALELWPTDRVQLCVQGLVLRENGYRCEEGIVYYATTKQRVRVEFSEAVIAETVAAIEQAWRVAQQRIIPEPLVDSPKCAGCSLAPICLPDEVNHLEQHESEPDPEQLTLLAAGEGGPPKKTPSRETRRLMAPRDDLRPAYLNTPGLRVGKSGTVLQVKERDALLQEIRLNEICQLNLMGNIQISTQAVQELCTQGIPICYFSQGGWFYGITAGLCTRNVFVRQRQFAMAEQAWFCRRLARSLVVGKIRNQRTFLLRNHLEPDPITLREMKEMGEAAEQCSSMEELLGIEGNAARLYFGAFQGLIKVEVDEDLPRVFRMDFAGRNRRPPRDAVNALLSLGYSLLAKDLTIACYAAGFDPMMGFYHQPRFGRPALALDLMEPFRALVVDSAVVTAINTKMVTPRDFVSAGQAVALTAEGRKGFYRAYELRMDTMVTHPLFGYRVSYRRLMEVQVRLLAKLLEGDIGEYPAFVTR
ncbi:MAG TPA: CRISPR-associated endonuclease Cas1 [Bryobacteraceae bacterium]|nr:CRISPR-associated endonuclease Cas1 [Bryobacteraceae bacterium]